MKATRAETHVRPDTIWDLLIRLSGIALLVLLIIAYSTGEEYPHTHVMIGFAIAALVAVSIFWAVIRPPHLHFPQTVSVWDWTGKSLICPSRRLQLFHHAPEAG